MPPVVENKKKFKDTLYGAVTAAGEQLPPVVFTSDQVDAGRNSERLLVKYLDRIKGPGNRSTEVWWDSLGQDYLDEEDDELWVDNLKSHHSKTFLEETRSVGLTIRYYPKYAGSILNPMDNSFWADFRACYYREPRDNHGQMLDAPWRCAFIVRVRTSSRDIGITVGTRVMKRPNRWWSGFWEKATVQRMISIGRSMTPCSPGTSCGPLIGS